MEGGEGEAAARVEAALELREVHSPEAPGDSGHSVQEEEEGEEEEEEEGGEVAEEEGEEEAIVASDLLTHPCMRELLLLLLTALRYNKGSTDWRATAELVREIIR
jgi:hypothetical protein